MSYKEKVAKLTILRNSLNKLLELAYEDPRLSLDQRRSVVAAIFLGGKNGCSLNRHLIPEFASRSHDSTLNGLKKAFSNKLNTTNSDLSDALMKISALSAWAFSTPNQCNSIIDNFSSQMVPEDTNQSQITPTESVMAALHSKWDCKKRIDFIVLSPKVWAEKYLQK